ncbi:MAG: penicillin-binding protein 2 [Bacteroidetes bacterium HGW-Bacteroidetes-4]|jgi:penicillin-binding protein 2|nr:MAG: penicillin-binding protein 2 [Bacteroidetes bacterium HGW-Bacteroidetes-4]
MNPFANRKYVIGSIFGLLILIYIIRLFVLQVIDQSYKLSASNNVLRYVTQHPARGLVYDRNGKLMVYNEAAYDLMVVPQQIEAFDTNEFCQMLDLTKEQVISRLDKAKTYSRFKSSVFEKQLSAKTYAAFQEKLYLYKGFFVETRTIRQYPQSTAAHVLGYVGEVNDEIATTDNYYVAGDYIGISGVEKSYEEVLRGKKGVEIFMVDVHNRIKGNYRKGRYDTAPEHGANVTLTIDAELQAYGELLMGNKIGSIVAIEPSTGEILALISSPAYNPELLLGRNRTDNYNALKNDTLKPLFNRPLMARYPPGSTFKTVNALIGLQEGIVKPETTFPCMQGYAAGRFFMKCHYHRNNLDLTASIQHSCNAYYAYEFRNLLDAPKYGSVESAFELWRNHVLSFGFGKKLGVDLPHEVNGYIPTLSLYNRIYGEGRLRSLNIVSLAIGQGELLMTPVQMANLTAIICNNGYYYAPHVIKDLPKEFNNMKMPYLVKRYTNVDSVHFKPIIEGMYLAVNGLDGGTARIAQIPGIEVCGKTGTAENPHGEDHSIFIAFAPKDNPKIALAVYIENGGFGATWAAPVASLMIEKYLTGTIKRKWHEERILNANLLDVRPKK